MWTRLHLDLGRDTVLDHACDDADKAIARRFAGRSGRIEARQGRHVARKAGSIDLPPSTGRAGSSDMSRINEAPHRVRAHSKQLGGLPDPEMLGHRWHHSKYSIWRRRNP